MQAIVAIQPTPILRALTVEQYEAMKNDGHAIVTLNSDNTVSSTGNLSKVTTLPSASASAGGTSTLLPQYNAKCTELTKLQAKYSSLEGTKNKCEAELNKAKLEKTQMTNKFSSLQKLYNTERTRANQEEARARSLEAQLSAINTGPSGSAISNQVKLLQDQVRDKDIEIGNLKTEKKTAQDERDDAKTKLSTEQAKSKFDASEHVKIADALATTQAEVLKKEKEMNLVIDALQKDITEKYVLKTEAQSNTRAEVIKKQQEMQAKVEAEAQALANLNKKIADDYILRTDATAELDAAVKLAEEAKDKEIEAKTKQIESLMATASDEAKAKAAEMKRTADAEAAARAKAAAEEKAQEEEKAKKARDAAAAAAASKPGPAAAAAGEPGPAAAAAASKPGPAAAAAGEPGPAAAASGAAETSFDQKNWNAAWKLCTDNKKKIDFVSKICNKFKMVIDELIIDSKPPDIELTPLQLTNINKFRANLLTPQYDEDYKENYEPIFEAIDEFCDLKCNVDKLFEILDLFFSDPDLWNETWIQLKGSIDWVTSESMKRQLFQKFPNSSSMLNDVTA